jgi:hypothetical protein
MMKYVFSLLFLFFLLNVTAQNNIGIGTSTPNASAILDVSSSNRGLLPPRMTAAQRNAITSPANGLMLYDTDSAALMIRSGGNWRKLSSSTGGDLWLSNGGDAIYSGNAGNVGIGVSAPLSKLDILGRILLRGNGNVLNTPGVALTNVSGAVYNGFVGTQSDSLMGFYGAGNNIPNSGWGLNMNVYNGRVGIGTNAAKAALHVSDSAVLFTGDVSAPEITTTINPPAQGGGTRMFWFPALGAFRAGYVDGVQWDRDSIGQLSFAAGYNTIAKGRFSVALGNNSRALGNQSFSTGSSSTASGEYSTSMGEGTTASAYGAISMGTQTTASEYASTSMGSGTKASGAYSTSMGYYTTASNFTATSMGYFSTASGSYSTSMGRSTTAFGDYSTSMGDSTLALGNHSTSMGNKTLAFGAGSIASGSASMAFGDYASSLGEQTMAKARGGFTTGVWNDNTDSPNGVTPAPGDRIFQIGNGTANNQRSSAVTVLRNGNMGMGTTAPLARLHVTDSAVLFSAPGLATAGPYPDAPIQGPGRRMMWYPAKAAFRAGYAGTEWDKDSIGRYSFASGFRNLAKGAASATFGEGSKATGPASFVVGSNSTATGYASLATGIQTKATGDYSTATGYFSEASGITSTAMGYEARATNNDAFAINQTTLASGAASFAAGTGTKAKALSSSAFGRYNDSLDTPDGVVPANTDRIFQIGNGTADNARSNALTVLRNGNIGIGTINPNALLQLSNGLSNRKIVLFDGVNNDHQYYGFGINNNVFRYQVGATTANHVFYAGNSAATSNELMRIQGNGNVGIGITDPSYLLDVGARMRIRSTPGLTAGLWLNNDANTSSPAFVGMFTNDEVGFYGQTGTPGWRFYVNTTTGNAFLQGTLTQASDARLKKNIVPLNHTLDAIQQLNGYTYNWKDDANPDEQIGLLAQELQKVYPQLVKENDKGILAVNYSGMVPVLLTAIKEQQQQIEELKKLVQQLINK